MPAIRAQRVLVIFKKSAFQIYVRERNETRIKRLLLGNDPAVRHMRKVHADQLACTRIVEETLRKLRLDYRLRYRAERFRTEGFDLVISVGGDGTLLEASHHVADTPVLAVNSSPTTSVGYFAAANATNFEERLKDALAGRLPIVPLQRMLVKKNDRPIPVAVLNDVLFCSDNPAATSRYILQVGRHIEAQKSSGMWLSTAAGSTAALRSAGGAVLPARSRRLAYVVREPYHDPGTRLALLGGSVGPGQVLRIISKMRSSAIYIDGSHQVTGLRLGDRLDFGPHPEPLRLLGFQRRD